MAPIKFEEQLKEKLEQRRIEPSVDSWNKLNNKLDANEDNKNSKGFWWIGIAATVAGVLLALTFVFKSNTEIVEPIIVDTKKETSIEKKDLQHLDVLNENTAVAIEESENKTKKNQEKETQKLSIKTPLKAIIKEQQDALILNKENEGVAEVNTKINLEQAKNNTIETSPELLSFESQKVNEVVAQIQKLQQENNEVTSQEIDALLEAAQKEITMRKLYNEVTNAVDANALLQSVEDDLDLSFRNKVFSAIKSGYETVKTAVAERNN